MSIFQLEQDVKAEVQERADEIKESIYPSDLLSELADSHIPVYYQELAGFQVKSIIMWFSIQKK